MDEIEREYKRLLATTGADNELWVALNLGNEDSVRSLLFRRGVEYGKRPAIHDEAPIASSRRGLIVFRQYDSTLRLPTQTIFDETDVPPRYDCEP